MYVSSDGPHALEYVLIYQVVNQIHTLEQVLQISSLCVHQKIWDLSVANTLSIDYCSTLSPPENE